MLSNRPFFKGLYHGSRSDNLCRIQLATRFQLDNCLLTLHFLCEGSIPWPKEKFNVVKKSRRIPHLYKLRDKDFLRKLVKSEKSEKRAFLNNLASLFHAILQPLFVKPMDNDRKNPNWYSNIYLIYCQVQFFSQILSIENSHIYISFSE